MPRVIAVAFEPLGRLYYFDSGEFDLGFGQVVLVPTGDGAEVAHCVWGPAELEGWGPLPACLGPATPADEARDEVNRWRRTEIAGVARALIARHDLTMRVVGVDFVDQSRDFDKQAVIYFESPGRVDFRALLIDLARALQARIDLRQIGSRDAAAIIGGCGLCGRELCCAVLGPPKESVSLRMARTQDLSNNPSQLLGWCGRLMCCLAYEQKAYADFQSAAPGIGAVVGIPEGTGTVVGHIVPLDSVLVQVNTERFTCPLSRLGARAPAGQA
jgi:cell fate regulator YaaT (PSP1 superfamily)